MIWSDDYGHLPLRQIGRECRQPTELVLRPAKFDRDVVAVDEPGFLQAVAECRYPVNGITSRDDIEETDHRYRRSLRPRRHRPCCRRAAQCEYEFSPSDVGCHATLPWGSCPCNGGDDITLYRRKNNPFCAAKVLSRPCINW